MGTLSRQSAEGLHCFMEASGKAHLRMAAAFCRMIAKVESPCRMPNLPAPPPSAAVPTCYAEQSL